MRETAKRAELVNPASNSEVVKVRVQSTPEEINCFKVFLDKCEELGMVEVVNFSRMFSNKGTTKYFRAYSDVILKEGEYENE